MTDYTIGKNQIKFIKKLGKSHLFYRGYKKVIQKFSSRQTDYSSLATTISHTVTMSRNKVGSRQLGCSWCAERYSIYGKEPMPKLTSSRQLGCSWCTERYSIHGWTLVFRQYSRPTLLQNHPRAGQQLIVFRSGLQKPRREQALCRQR